MSALPFTHLHLHTEYSLLILIVNTSIENAIKAAENIRSRIESNVYCNGLHITCSLGVAPLSSSLAKCIEAADKALYEAKKGGRNQVRCAALKYE